MGDNIVELGSGGVIVRAIGAGSALGFGKPTPAFAISTMGRSASPDYVVLSREEAVKVAIGILLDEDHRQHSDGKAIAKLAWSFGVDARKLRELQE